jgi:hypothetical protein
VDDTAGSIAQQLNRAVGQADGIISFLTASWEFFATTLGTAKNIMSDQVLVALERMQAQLSGIIWVARLIVSGIQAMANAFTRSLDIIGETLNDTGDAFDMVTQKILNINWGETVGKKANEVAEKAKELGKNLVTGVSDGIKSAVTEVEKTAKGLGNAVLDILGITWDIKSPSKETFAMGKEGIDKGLELGLLAGIPGIKAAVQVMGLETLSALDTYLYIPFMSKMNSLVPYTGGGSAWANLPPGTPWPVQQTLPTQNKTTGEWSGLYMGMQPLIDALGESGQKADDLGGDMQDAALKIQTAADKLVEKFNIPLGGPEEAEQYGYDQSYVRTHFPTEYADIFQGTEAETFMTAMLGDQPDEFFKRIQSVLKGSYDSVNKEDPMWPLVVQSLLGTQYEIPPEIIDEGGPQLRAWVMAALAAATSGLIPEAFPVDPIVTNMSDALQTEERVMVLQQALINSITAQIRGTPFEQQLKSQGIELGDMIGTGFIDAHKGVDQFKSDTIKAVDDVSSHINQSHPTYTIKVEFEYSDGGASVGGGSGGSGLNPNQGPGGTGGVIGMQRGGTLWTRGAGSGDTIPFFAMLAPRERLTVMPGREVMTSGGGVSKVLNINIGSINTGMDEALLKHRVQQWAFEE